MFHAFFGRPWQRAIDAAVGRLPSRCALCHTWPTEPVCEVCVGRFAQPRPRCHCCALPVPLGIERCGACLVAPPPLDQCLAAAPYGYPWSDLIASFKFNGHPSWARPLALLLRSMPFVEPALDQADLILPVPLSPARLRSRGYNQSWELARRVVSSANARKLDSALLLRTIDTAAQSGLNRAERLRNLRAAFVVDPLRVPALKGRRVVLIDDVMTTGATLHAAALTLRDAGASHITGMVFARTDLSS